MIQAKLFKKNNTFFLNNFMCGSLIPDPSKRNNALYSPIFTDIVFFLCICWKIHCVYTEVTDNIPNVIYSYNIIYYLFVYK